MKKVELITEQQLYPPTLDEKGCDGDCENCPTEKFNDCQAESLLESE